MLKTEIFKKLFDVSVISPENWGQWERHLKRNSSLHICTKNKQRNNSKQYNTDLLCLLQGGSSSPKNTGFVRLRRTTIKHSSTSKNIEGEKDADFTCKRNYITADIFC